MSRTNLLLVPFVTELEWEMIQPQLEEWAEVATYDPPGVGSEPLPAELEVQPERWEEEGSDALARWRQACAERGLAEAERRGWSGYVVAADSYGIAPAVRLALGDRERVRGLALGHAALSHALNGPRAPISKEIWEALTALLRTDVTGFIAAGVAQLTQGAVSDEQASRWMERFPDRRLVISIWELLGRDPEPIDDALRELGLPLLLAQHVGCLSETQEGYDDIVAEFPHAQTVGCPEACAASPAFVAALQEFCEGL